MQGACTLCSPRPWHERSVLENSGCLDNSTRSCWRLRRLLCHPHSRSVHTWIKKPTKTEEETISLTHWPAACRLLLDSCPPPLTFQWGWARAHPSDRNKQRPPAWSCGRHVNKFRHLLSSPCPPRPYLLFTCVLPAFPQSTDEFRLCTRQLSPWCTFTYLLTCLNTLALTCTDTCYWETVQSLWPWVGQLVSAGIKWHWHHNGIQWLHKTNIISSH